MYTFTLSGTESVLSAKIYPPIVLHNKKTYAIGLIDFVTYNSIPNVDSTNNKFYINSHTTTIPDGSYEIIDIERFILKSIGEKNDVLNREHQKVNRNQTNQIKKTPVYQTKQNVDQAKQNVNQEKLDEKETYLIMRLNRNTLRYEIKSNKSIHFDKPESIAGLLGFERKTLSPNNWHISSSPINISEVNSICVECNRIKNSYQNNTSVHVLHTFHPNVPSGYRIIEKVQNVIYLPINTNYIDEIIPKIIDRDGDLINFQREVITVRVHLKEV
nr:unnamed protein product [Callosobruchus analis]